MCAHGGPAMYYSTTNFTTTFLTTKVTPNITRVFGKKIACTLALPILYVVLQQDNIFCQIPAMIKQNIIQNLRLELGDLSAE